MRFFKYLVFILLTLISFDVFATIYIPSGGAAAGKEFSSGLSACHTSLPTYEGVYYKDHNDTEGGCYSSLGYLVPVQKKPSPICPPKNSLYVAWLPKGTTSIPLRMCIDNCTYEGSGLLTETPNYVNTTLFATGDQLNCKNVNSDTPPPKCDTKDPYGDCFVPPDDDCVRSKDGSITCPPNTPPIAPKDPCNGATYCKKPPTGCGSGYVSGFFNGQALCVKSGPSTPPVKPNDPNDPDDPNKCTASYCPKPDDTKDCPSGYYQTTYNGEKVCVKNNPDPTQPNSHDPNNNNNNDNQPPSSEPTGSGDAAPFCEKSGKVLCDAVKAIKDFFTKEPSKDDMQDTPLQVQEEKIIDYQRQEHVRFGQYCPFEVTTEQVGFITLQKDLTWICTFGYQARPYIIAIGYLGALIYLLIGLRSKD